MAADIEPVLKPAPSPVALRPFEMAKALGISERTLSDWAADPAIGIPVIRINGCVLYPLDSVRDWLREKAKAATLSST